MLNIRGLNFRRISAVTHCEWKYPPGSYVRLPGQN